MTATVINKRFNSLFRASILFICVFALIELAEYSIAGCFTNFHSLAAMQLVSPILTFLTFVSIMLTSGTMTLYSYAVSRADRYEANGLYSQGVIMCVVVGLIISFAMMVLPNFTAIWPPVTPEILDEAHNYLGGIIPRPLFYFLDYLLMGILMTEGKNGLCIKSAIVQLILNIVLGVILCRAWGIYGLSMAATISVASSALVKAKYLFDQDCPLKFRFCVKPRQICRSFGFGVYSALQPLMQTLMIIATTEYILQNFNADTLVIYSIVLKITALGTSISDAVTEAMQPMVCVYHAEGNYVGVDKVMRRSMKSGLMAELCLMLALLISAPFLPELFGVTEAEMAYKTSYAVCLSLLGLPLFLFVHVNIYCYIYTERRQYALLLQPLLIFAAPVVSMTLLGTALGESGLWLYLFVSCALVALVNFILTWFVSWKTNGVYKGIWLPNTKKMTRQLAYDCIGTAAEVTKISRQAQRDLAAWKVPPNKRNKAAVLIEDMGILSADNSTTHAMPLEITLTYEHDSLELIVRSIGLSHDITDEDISPLSFRQYFLTQMVTAVDKENYLLMGKENRTVIKI